MNLAKLPNMQFCVSAGKKLNNHRLGTDWDWKIFRQKTLLM